MSSRNLTADDGYQSLLGKISGVYTTGQARATQAVNTHITETYWQIGRDIVEFEQGGKTRADYGTGLLASLSLDLSLRHGKGFSRSNVKRFRQFYLVYPKGAKASHLLSWSHYVELLKLDDELERSFYEQQSLREKWSVPELMRQKKSSLFLRLAAGKDKDAILQLASQGQIVLEPADLLRGIEADIGKEHADTFRRGLRADYVLANPPFNDSDWFRNDADVRWQKSEQHICNL